MAAMSVKAYVLNELENEWAGFLYDKDCQSAVVKTFFQPGTDTSKREDIDTVVEAREGVRTPVTSNGKDFIRYTRQVQRKMLNPRCQDCWGLIIVPNEDLVREKALEKAQIKHGICIGGLTIPWKAVAYANLCVRVDRGGEVNVSRFKRCTFCQRDFPISKPWYDSLPII